MAHGFVTYEIKHLVARHPIPSGETIVGIIGAIIGGESGETAQRHAQRQQDDNYATVIYMAARSPCI